MKKFINIPEMKKGGSPNKKNKTAIQLNQMEDKKCRFCSRFVIGKDDLSLVLVLSLSGGDDDDEHDIIS